jgi:uncharacterized protein YuzE
VTPYSFQLTVDTDDATGEVLAAYFQVRKGKVHRTVEFAKGNAFADYDRKGSLMGIEVIGSCRTSIVDQIAAAEPSDLRTRVKRFMRQAGPRKMVAA